MGQIRNGDDSLDDIDVVTPLSSPVGLTAAAAGLTSIGLGDTRSWRPALRPYERADWRSAFQLVSALAMFVGGWAVALWSLDVSYALTMLFVCVIAVSIVRCFIIFHDCGHGSFARSKQLNDVVGSLLGVIVLTPFRHWNYAHALHHATSSDLDRRGFGDVWTLTVEEFRAATPRRQVYYRAYHNMFVMLMVGPIIKFVVLQRLVTLREVTPLRARRSVPFTNVGVVLFAGGMVALVGPTAFLLVQVPASIIAGATAIWLFYVQHCFEGAYWSRRSNWKYVDAALRGSSHLDLGRVLRYVSGNIGFHHLHHLDARIPNYNLPRCSREHPELEAEHVFTLRESFQARHLKLWDEDAGRYVGYEAAS